MNIKNIIFSTTRQWNPGDEFILHGTLRLIRSVSDSDICPIIFNRNPDIRPTNSIINKFRKNRYSNTKFSGRNNLEAFVRIGQFDNSVKDDLDYSFVDKIVFAGSPEWIGRRSLPLYKIALDFNIPTIFLGIGASRTYDYSEIKPIYRKVLENAELITVRDSITEDILRPLSPERLPCPAFYSAPQEHIRKTRVKIALIYGSSNAAGTNKINPKIHEYIITLYNELLAHYDAEIVCHYIDELPEAYRHFPGAKIHYNYDSSEYWRIYNRFDLVIGPRVHGVGISASLGAPGILIGHDKRSETVEGFGADIITDKANFNQVTSLIDKKSEEIEEQSRKILTLKKSALKKYQSLLSPLFNNIEND